MKNLKEQTIFIVDDDPFWSCLLTQILKDLGFENISSFANEKDFMEQLGEQPELIFLDYQLEESDGLELLQKIKVHNSAIEVIFCTALEDLGVAISAIEYGSYEYLLKSNTSEEVVSKIIDSFQYPKVA